MGFFSFLSKREEKNDVLTSIFKVAERGIYNINFPISNEGQFEIMMFDVWLGTKIMEEKILEIDFMLMQNKIEDYLKQNALKLNLPPEKKCERIYMFREEGWEHDVMGLVHSDYPRTKQFLPGYMYLCMVAKPLVVFDHKTTGKKIDEIPIDSLVDFLGPFCDHYSWLLKQLQFIK